MKVYLALCEYDHEGFSVMGVYASKEAADARVAMCRAHRAKRPPWPPLGCGSHSPEWKAWSALSDAWENAAPEGFEKGDGYSVDEFELIEAPR